MGVLKDLSPEDLEDFDKLDRLDRIAILAHLKWVAEAKSHQIMPSLDDDSWNIWMILAGRGAGKTRAAVEATWWYAWTHPKSRCGVMAPTSGDLAKTVFRGQSGFINVIPPELVADYNKSDHLITLMNGSQIQGYPGEAYERLRGPEHHFFWCDELAAFQYLGEGEAWDMMQFGLRLGNHPRVIVTTTPKPKDLILELVGREDEDVIIDRASTFANKENLAKAFIEKLESYKGTKLYNQEVLGEVVDLEDGKTVQRSMFRLWPASKPLPEFLFILQSYDCAFSEKEHNDPTAATTWGVFQPQDGPTSVMLIDCWQDHLSFPDLKPRVLDEFRVSYGEPPRQKMPNLILVENKAAGISIIQELQKAHLPCAAYNPGKADKMQRLQIAATALAAKRVWLPESAKKKGYVKDWVEPALSQWCSFPDATHDDFVDSMSQALRYLMDSKWIQINPPPRDDSDDLVDARRQKANPYDG